MTKPKLYANKLHRGLLWKIWNIAFCAVVALLLYMAFGPEVHSVRVREMDRTVSDYRGMVSEAQVYAAAYTPSGGGETKRNDSNKLTYPAAEILVPQDLTGVTEFMPDADTLNLYFDVQAGGRTVGTFSTEEEHYDNLRVVFPENAYYVGKTVPELLALYRKSGYLTAFALSNAGPEVMSPEVQEELQAMGFATTPADVAGGDAWVGVWQNGQVLAEKSGSGEVQVTVSFPAEQAAEESNAVGSKSAVSGTDAGNGAAGTNEPAVGTGTAHILDITARGTGSGDCAIVFDGFDYSGSHANDGLYIFVYDTVTNRLIDSVEYSADAMATMNRNTEYFKQLYRPVYKTAFLNHVAAIYTAHDNLRHVQYTVLALIVLFLWFAVRRLAGAGRTGTPQATAARQTSGESADGNDEESTLPEYRGRARNAGRPKKSGVLFFLKWFFYALLLILAGIFIVGWNYVYRKFPELSIDQLFFHLGTNTQGADWSNFYSLFALFGAGAGIAVVVTVILARMEVRAGSGRKTWKWSLFSTFLAFAAAFLMYGIAAKFFAQYKCFDYMVSRAQKTDLYDRYYADPATTKITFPAHKKNLIYIYMESYEITAASTDVGGGKTFNAEPELSALALSPDGDCFNGRDADGKLNGGLMLGTTSWTMAGMIAQTAGVPLNIPAGGTQDDANNLSKMPGLTNLGDVLEAEGYHNVLYIGSDANFANRRAYFTEHGDYDIDDYYWAIDQGLVPSDYYVWWGYEDEKLFAFAKDEAAKLAAERAEAQVAGSDKPFNLTLLTTDTHFSNGYVCDDCPDTYPNQYGNVIACSSKRVSDFIAWCKTQDWYDDTVIIVSGDHLYMDASYYRDAPDGYQRKTYVDVVNSAAEEPEKARTFSTLDLFPTTLGAMGCTIDGGRLGLGTDLYSDTPTLEEELGVDSFNYQLGLQSDYYNEKLVGGE